MNGLRKDIEKGSRIQHFDGTEAVAFGGFGLRASTMGSAVMVTLDNGEKERWDGHDVIRLLAGPVVSEGEAT